MEGVEQITVRETAGGVTVPVKVIPGSSKDEVAGILGDRLKIKTAAAPEAGKANKRICMILAAFLQVPRDAVRIERGASGPLKDIRILGISAQQCKQRLSDC